MSKLNIVILAAGQGTRMKSLHPKVLHPLGGKPLLGHVIETARSLKPAKIIVVYGHGGEQVPAALGYEDVIWVEQAEQLGTGHAVEQAMPEIDDNSTLLVLYGDVPLLRDSTMAELVRMGDAGFGLLTVHVADAGGYGRILRDQHGAVEQRTRRRASYEPDHEGEDDRQIHCGGPNQRGQAEQHRACQQQRQAAMPQIETE